MYQQDGLINSFIDTVTFGALAGRRLARTTRAPRCRAIIVLSIWQAVGFHMLIWLSGLQTIPEELYEAARMDGAEPVAQFTNVTWPGLRSTMVFVLVTITIAALGLFVQIDVMTQGGPQDSTTTHRLPRRPQGLPAAGDRLRRRDLAHLLRRWCSSSPLIQRRLTREKD